jgi:hypothetical protein
LIIRSEHRVMSHSANIGFGRPLAADRFRSSTTSTASPLSASGSTFDSSSLRATLSDIKKGSIFSIGHTQPRFTLVVTNLGPTNRSWAR